MDGDTWTGRDTWRPDLVDVLVRVVHEEVVVLEAEVHANILGEPHQDLIDREHDLVLVLGAVVRLDIHHDLLRRGQDLVETAEHVGQDRRHDVRAARKSLIHVVENVAVAMRLTTEVARTSWRNGRREGKENKEDAKRVTRGGSRTRGDTWRGATGPSTATRRTLTPMIRKMRWFPPSAFFGHPYRLNRGHAVFAWSMKS